MNTELMLLLESTVTLRRIKRHILYINKPRTIIPLYLSLPRAQLSIIALLVWAADHKMLIGQKENPQEEKNLLKAKVVWKNRCMKKD